MPACFASSSIMRSTAKVLGVAPMPRKKPAGTFTSGSVCCTWNAGAGYANESTIVRNGNGS